MTNKAFFEFVINANLSDEVTAKAKHLLALAENKTAKRAEKTTANTAANLEIAKTIIATFAEGTTYAVSEIAPNFPEISKAKITAVLKVAAENNLVTIVDGYKVGGKGRAVKGYALAPIDDTEIDGDFTED